MKEAQAKTGTKEGTLLSPELKQVGRWWLLCSVANLEMLVQAFQQYPETLDEIDACIHEERARAECNIATNPEVAALYI